MNFDRDLQAGLKEFFLALNERISHEPSDILFVFRYWTAFVILEFLKLECQFEMQEEVKLLEKFGFLATSTKEKWPVLLYRVSQPFDSLLLLAIDTNQTPFDQRTSLPKTATLLLENAPIFDYHIFLLASEAPHDLLLCSKEKFSLSSEHLIDIAKKIQFLYQRFDFHEITETSSLLSWITDDVYVMSTGGLTEQEEQPEQIKQKSSLSTGISWPELESNLKEKLYFLKPDLYILEFLTTTVEEKKTPTSFSKKHPTHIQIPSDYKKPSLKKKIQKDQELLQLLDFPINDLSVIKKILYPPFKALEEMLRISFFTASIEKQEEFLDVWIPVARMLLHIHFTVFSKPGPKYILLLLPILYKQWIDTMIQAILKDQDKNRPVELRILGPNLKSRPFTLFVPFRLPDFPWLPNLLLTKKSSWWFQTPEVKQIFENILQKDPQAATELEPTISKDLSSICISNKTQKECVYKITFDPTTNTISEE